MKRTFKKAFAALTATAIAASSFAVTSFAAVTNANSGTAYSFDVKSNLPEGYALSDVYGAKFTISISDLSSGVGGALGLNSEVLGWQQKGWGNEGSNQELIMSNDDYSVTYIGEAPIFDDVDNWASIDVQQWWGGDFAVSSVEALDKDGNVICFDKSLVQQEEATEYIELSTGSIGATTLAEDTYNPGYIAKPTVTLDNKWGNAFAVEGYSYAEITFTCENPDEVANIYLVAQNGTIGWHQTSVNAAASGTITLDLSGKQDTTYEALIAMVEPASTYAAGDEFDPGFTVTSAKLYKIPTEDDSAYAGSTSVEIAEGDNLWWKEVVISKEELIGDIDPATIEKVVFSTNSAYNFGIGYNSTEIIGTNADGSDNYWIDATNGSSNDMELYDINFDYYGLMAILAPGSVGTYEISWKVYTKPALVESLNGTSVTLGDTIGVNLYFDLGEEILADDEAVVEYFFADGDCCNDLISYGEATENGYMFTVYVDAKEMADEFTAQVVAGDGRRGEIYTVSVKEYADQILNAEEGTYTEETIALVEAMLVYGGYAQEYFDYNTDNLASDGLDTAVSAARITSSYEMFIEGELPEGMSFYGTSLILEGTTTVRLYFTASDELAEAYGLEANGDYYFYDIASIYATDIDTEYEVTFGDCTIYCSALSYAYTAINGGTENEELVNLVKALRLYNMAADAYAAA